jgi:DNA helicase-2/ATP-dependent DNA helicase PcrA
MKNKLEAGMITLNQEQKKAASFTHGTAAVVAVPGAGKTLTMTHRIGNLVKNHGVAPESILGLTFTRNAASAMKEKLRSILKDIAPRVTLATIHAFCNSLLRNEGRAFEILSEKEQLTMIKKIMKKHKMGQIPAGMVVKEIGLAKNNLVAADEFKDLHTGDATMAKIAKVYGAYEKEKEKRIEFRQRLFLFA